MPQTVLAETAPVVIVAAKIREQPVNTAMPNQMDLLECVNKVFIRTPQRKTATNEIPFACNAYQMVPVIVTNALTMLLWTGAILAHVSEILVSIEINFYVPHAMKHVRPVQEAPI